MSPVSLADLPDDMVRLILGKCDTTRAVVSLGCTCRRMRALVDDLDTLPPMTLTCMQDDSAHAWARSPHIARKFRWLTARRCVFSAAPWISKFSGLTTLVLTFCRVGVDILGRLPLTLTHLDIHALVPRPEYESGRMSFQRMTKLRTLVLTFLPSAWNVAFVAKLPKGLRDFRVRGAKALVIESRMPSGLRRFHAAADSMLLMCNRLPNRVTDVHMACDSGTTWLRETMPLRPVRLERLALRFRTVGAVPRLCDMRRLQSLALCSTTLSVNWSTLSKLPALTSVSLDAAHWLVATHSTWASHRPLPAIRATVGDVEASDAVAPKHAAPKHAQPKHAQPKHARSPAHEPGGEHGHGLGADAGDGRDGNLVAQIV